LPYTCISCSALALEQIYGEKLPKNRILRLNLGYRVYNVALSIRLGLLSRVEPDLKTLAMRSTSLVCAQQQRPNYRDVYVTGSVGLFWTTRKYFSSKASSDSPPACSIAEIHPAKGESHASRSLSCVGAFHVTATGLKGYCQTGEFVEGQEKNEDVYRASQEIRGEEGERDCEVREGTR